MPLIEQTFEFAGGGILYDASRLRKAQPHLFSRDHWRGQGAMREMAGGRGSVCFLAAPEGNWVLRHYQRGGLIRHISADSYLWLGAARTRSFREWRLLAELHERGLPVPAPVAAGYARSGLLYRADIITEEVPETKTLAQVLSEEVPLDVWRRIGRTIGAFHAHGVQHADLNAHNILLSGARREVYVIDFDRGRIRARGAWEQAVLARLRRSLLKIAGLSRRREPEPVDPIPSLGTRGRVERARFQFDEAAWNELLRGVGETQPLRA